VRDFVGGDRGKLPAGFRIAGDAPSRAARVLHSGFCMTSRKAIAKIVSLVALGVAVALGAACVDVPATVQTVTYGPNFSYIPKERVQSSMWILAAEIGRLDDLLEASPDGKNLRAQIEIQNCLRRLSAAVEQIDHPGRSTQHPVLNQNLHRFAERISAAQRGAERTPPNYFLASSLSGSCFLCHGSADEAGVQ
jgi:hypothetical protein